MRSTDSGKVGEYGINRVHARHRVCLLRAYKALDWSKVERVPYLPFRLFPLQSSIGIPK
jgi:hypothetical protein